MKFLRRWHWIVDNNFVDFPLVSTLPSTWKLTLTIDERCCWCWSSSELFQFSSLVVAWRRQWWRRKKTFHSCVLIISVYLPFVSCQHQHQPNNPINHLLEVFRIISYYLSSMKTVMCLFHSCLWGPAGWTFSAYLPNIQPQLSDIWWEYLSF